jgi:hypothetical protein
MVAESAAVGKCCGEEVLPFNVVAATGGRGGFRHHPIGAAPVSATEDEWEIANLELRIANHELTINPLLFCSRDGSSREAPTPSVSATKGRRGCSRHH